MRRSEVEIQIQGMFGSLSQISQPRYVAQSCLYQLAVLSRAVWLLGEADTPKQLLRGGRKEVIPSWTFLTVCIPTLHSSFGVFELFCADCHGSSLGLDSGEGPGCSTL